MNKLVHGTISDSGMVFWGYEQNGKERWHDPNKFLFISNRAATSQKRKYWNSIDASRAKVKEWGRLHPETKRTSYNNWAERNKGRIRNNRLVRSYNITEEDYQEMLRKQNYCCAICGNKETQLDKNGVFRDLCVDHCHTTKEVRGLLCINCNVAIGKLKDDVNLMQSAINYINKSKVGQYTFQMQQSQNAEIGKIGTAPASMGGVNTQTITR